MLWFIDVAAQPESSKNSHSFPLDFSVFLLQGEITNGKR